MDNVGYSCVQCFMYIRRTEDVPKVEFTKYIKFHF